jgi:hypothetical protein
MSHVLGNEFDELPVENSGVTDPNKILIAFLRQLANLIERKELTEEKMCKIGEFFIQFLFQENINSNGVMANDEFMKFLTLGWYIYTQVLNV